MSAIASPRKVEEFNERLDGLYRQIEGWLGEEQFREGMRRYIKKHEWGNATAGDLYAALSEVSGRDVGKVMNSFTDQTGVPVLRAACRAGEGDGADSVRQAVHLCGAHRLGHATRLIEDESLTSFVTDRRIALEVCLTSNVQTRAVESFAAHPARQYLVISSVGPLFSSVSSLPSPPTS